MPIDPDFSREERIKRLRSLIKSGTDQMLILYDAIPAYVRLADPRMQKDLPGLEGKERLFDRLPDEVARDQGVRLGYFVAERNHGTYSKVYKWLTAADNASPRNLSDDSFIKYRDLDSSRRAWIDSRAPESVEDQIVSLSRALESRIAIFQDQLRLDGEHDDVSHALRDSPGGWPHLRSPALLNGAVLDGYLTRMRKRRTKAEISDSIGGAKEVTEATMKAIVTKHGLPVTSATPDLADYWKALRPYLINSTVDKALGSKDGAVIKLVSAQVSTIQTLGELRNRVGTGHGRSSHPAGLQSGHALLAVDTAHAVTRFLTS